MTAIGGNQRKSMTSCIMNLPDALAEFVSRRTEIAEHWRIPRAVISLQVIGLCIVGIGTTANETILRRDILREDMMFLLRVRCKASSDDVDIDTDHDREEKVRQV